MPKGKILQDSFEQVVEAGGSVVKKGAKQVAKTMSPLQMIENVLGQEEVEELKKKEKKSNGDNHTPLDVKKLEDKIKPQDVDETAKVRNRLFQLVKEGEEKELNRKKREKSEEEQREEQEKIAKQKEEEEKKRAQQQEEPKGKQSRGSLFSHKKVAQREHAEFKPSSGKQ